MPNHHLGFPIETVAVFIILAVGAIVIDLYAHRSDKPMSLKSASLWTVFWIVVSLAFAGYLGWHHDSGKPVHHRLRAGEGAFRR